MIEIPTELLKEEQIVIRFFEIFLRNDDRI